MRAILRSLLLGMIFAGFATVAQASVSSQNGWPTPWPFPWAKDCQIDWGQTWSQMQGRYQMTDGSDSTVLVLEVSEEDASGVRTVKAVRYDADGTRTAVGTGKLVRGKMVIILDLIPVNRHSTPKHAMIKLHYANSKLQCSPSDLMPILKWVDDDQNEVDPTEFLLLPIQPN